MGCSAPRPRARPHRRRVSLVRRVALAAQEDLAVPAARDSADPVSAERASADRAVPRHKRSVAPRGLAAVSEVHPVRRVCHFFRACRHRSDPDQSVADRRRGSGRKWLCGRAFYDKCLRNTRSNRYLPHSLYPRI